MERRISDRDSGGAVVRVLIAVAIAVPVGYVAFQAVRDSVRNETLRTDMRNAIDLEASCNEDRNGVGYSPGANRRGGALVLQCGTSQEKLRPSSGNRLVITVQPDGTGFVIVGSRADTGAQLRYDSLTAKWS